MRFAKKSADCRAVIQFDLPDAQRRWNARHERSEGGGREAPDLHVNGGAVAVAISIGRSQKPRLWRRGVGQREQAIVGRRRADAQELASQ